MFLYSALLTAGAIVSAPWWLVRMATTNRYREGLTQRLGRIPTPLREAVAQKESTKLKVLWLHAVSVGEVLAATRLVPDLEQALEEALDPAYIVVISTTTRTGQALAQQRFGAARVFYFPFDFATTTRRYLRLLQPAAVILMESEIWPRMLHECRRRNIPVIVANARVSDRSFHRTLKFRQLKRLWSRVLANVTLWLPQSDPDARRLIALGISPAAITVAGNLKYDVRAPKPSPLAALIKTVAGTRPILLAGSTTANLPGKHPEEEESVLNAWTHLPQREKGVLLVLAPRHPERFNLVDCRIPVPHIRATALLAHTTPQSLPQVYDVVLLDTIGDLAALYQIADVAFVGGSLVRRGGHNPLEPAQFAVPIVIGPHFENFREIVDTMKASDALTVAHNEQELHAAFDHLLSDRPAAIAMADRAHRVFEIRQGATTRTVSAILALLQTEAHP